MSRKDVISRERPEGFIPNVEASGCCIIHDDKILLLKRHPQKPQGNTWGVPGGKMEQGESIRDCAIREIHEEAGVDIDDETLTFLGSLYCTVSNEDEPFNFIFHLYKITFDILPTLNIGLSEHLEAGWFTLDEAYALPLINGGKEVLDYFSESISSTVL